MFATVFITFATLLLAEVAATNLLYCDSWVENSGTICFIGPVKNRQCNPATFTEWNSCGEKYCCIPVAPKPPSKIKCAQWVYDNNQSCDMGVKNLTCRTSGTSQKCSTKRCCKTSKPVTVITNCYEWTDSGNKCSGELPNGWKDILTNYRCLVKVQTFKVPQAQQNGIGPCSVEQCCALLLLG